LAADAQNESSIEKLRLRKGRADKPLALMAPSVQDIRGFCHVSPEEERQLLLPARPIVLLRRRSGAKIAPAVAPGSRLLGFMLPSAPLHYLLLSGQCRTLVMTSGNRSEEPIAASNGEALERLSEIADYFLVHNRDIVQRCDDSVVRVVAARPRLIRRARGYVPEPIRLKVPVSHRILACGGELKNTIALSRDDQVFLSQHIGDLDNPLALKFFEATIEHLSGLLEIQPEVIAYDMHPGYLSTQWALAQQNLPSLAVQHHHAHLASLLAENGESDSVIGIILDGTGYGLDETIWGGEVLIGGFSSVKRFAWLRPFRLPGGSAAVRNPWRTALAVLMASYGEDWIDLDLPVMRSLDRSSIHVLTKMISKGINSPLTSSCGRLFDSVSAILGIRSEVTYEAQAAVELEMVADENETGLYREALKELRAEQELEWAPLIMGVVNSFLSGEGISRISAKFHRTLAEIFLSAAISARQNSGIEVVGLSGGVFQNNLILTFLSQRLAEEGFQVLTHSQVPTNDGGISLGQVAVANATASTLRLASI